MKTERVLKDIFPGMNIQLMLKVLPVVVVKDEEVLGSCRVHYNIESPPISRDAITKIIIDIEITAGMNAGDNRTVVYHEATHAALRIVRLMKYNLKDLDDGKYSELLPHAIGMIAETILRRLDGDAENKLALPKELY